MDEPFFIRAVCFFDFLSSFLVALWFFHVILSYLTTSIFRGPMLNCFWTECCSFYFAVTPLWKCQQCHCRDLSAKVFPAFSFLLFLKFRSIKSSDTKISGHFNFRTKSLSDIKLSRNFSLLM